MINSNFTSYDFLLIYRLLLHKQHVVRNNIHNIIFVEIIKNITNYLNCIEVIDFCSRLHIVSGAFLLLRF